MKTSNKIFLGLFAAIALNFLTSMVLIRGSLVPRGIGNGETRIQGEKNIKKIRLPVQDFSQMIIGDDFTTTLIQGTEEFVEIETDANLIEYFDPKVKDEKLTLRIKDGYTLLPTEGVQITIGFKQLKKLIAYSNINISSSKQLNLDTLHLEIHGSGDIAFDVKAQQLDLRINGSGKGHFKGTADQLKVAVIGSGDFRGEGLVSRNANINISGSGYANLKVTNHLEATMTGSGAIRYSGNPATVNQRIAGSGRLLKN